jgi:citrate lyase beta subunit
VKTWLFCPGNDASKLEKALRTQADVVVIDWEDAVDSSKKREARDTTADVLTHMRTSQRVLVRVNVAGSSSTTAELELLADLPIDGIMVPKCDDTTQIEEFDRFGLPLVPLIENANGLERVQDIVSSMHNVERIAFGSLDFFADIGVWWDGDSPLLSYARTRISIASRAAGLAAPIDGVYPLLEDLDGLTSDSRKAMRLGFAGKLVVHPRQVDPVRTAFSPNRAEIERARSLLQANERMKRQGVAVHVFDGELVDAPVLRLARLIVEAEGESE